MNKKTLVALDSVSKTYNSGRLPFVALRNVSLNIQEGDFICIAGPSGSGKTTLMNIIGCIDTPTSGSVYINGYATDKFSRSQAAAVRLENIGFIFQSSNLIPVLTAYENVEYVLMIKKVPFRERAEIVQKALASVGLADHMYKAAVELSGGQQQRVAVARAIAMSPPIVLADEPTANLDSKTGEALIQLLRSLNLEHKITFVFSSHDPRIIGQADRVIKLHDGEIIGS